MDIYKFIQNHDVIHASPLITKADIQLAEKALGMKFGPQLFTYLLDYGFLMFNGVEFFGLNARQGLESDLVKETKYLHQYFPVTVPYIAFEDAGDGAYILVDLEDNVYYFDSEDDSIEDLEQKLNDYILEQFELMLEPDEDME